MTGDMLGWVAWLCWVGSKILVPMQWSLESFKSFLVLGVFLVFFNLTGFQFSLVL